MPSRNARTGILACLIIAAFVAAVVGAGIGIGILVSVQKSFIEAQKYAKNSSLTSNPDNYACTTSSAEFYLFNLTNYDKVLNGSERSHFEEVGPYVYDRDVCKFNVTVVDNHEYYNKFSPPGRFRADLSGKSLSDSDIIYNFNPDYLLILAQVSAAAGTTQPEYFFGIQGVPTAFSQFIEGMQTPQFVSSVVAGATSAVVLPQVKAAATNETNFMFFARVLTVLGFIGSVPLSDTINFWTDDTYAYGYANYTSITDLTPQSISLLLSGDGTPGSQPMGWGNTAFKGAGVQVLLITPYSSAVGEIYNMTEVQYTALQNYTSHLLKDLAPIFNPYLNRTAAGMFYDEWANSAMTGSSNTPFSVENVTSHRLGLTFNVSAGYRSEVAEALWDSTHPLSFMNKTVSSLWIAPTSDQQALLSSAFGLTTDQVTNISAWFNHWMGVANSAMKGQFEITNDTQFAYVQWGTGALLGGLSIVQLAHAGTAPFEIALSSNYTVTFSAARSEELINLSLNSTFVGQLLGLVSAGQFGVINSTYNLNQNQAIALATLYNSMIVNYVDVGLKKKLEDERSGLIAPRTPTEWLYTANDTLVFMATGGAQISGIEGLSSSYTMESAKRKKDLIKDEIWNGGSSDAYKKYLLEKEYKGNSTVSTWKNPFEVSGNQVPNMMPGFKKGEQLLLWSDDFIRPIPFEDSGDTVDREGITLRLYNASAPFWQSSYKNPDNDNYYMNYDGVVNLTHLLVLPTYITRPHFAGVDPIFVGDYQKFKPEVGDYDLTLGIEPKSGITMYAKSTAQWSFGYSNVDRFHPNLIDKSGVFPLYYKKTEQGVDADTASKFKSGLKKAIGIVIAAFVIGPLIAVGCVIAAILFYRSWRTTTVETIEIGTHI